MNNVFRYFILIPVLFSWGDNISQNNLTEGYEYNFFSEKKLAPGEELTYIVSYSLLKLGEVKIKVKDVKNVGGKAYYNTVAYIDSYSGIPFVNLHQIYESHLSTGYYSYYFKGLVKTEEYTTFTEYNFDYDKTTIKVKKGKVHPFQLWNDSTTSADKHYQDGLSILFYARMNFGQKKSVSVPCFVNEQKVFTKINFYTNEEEVSIDAVDYDVSCVKLDGETDFISVFGLTGNFEGWFSNDEASIPILAKMHVIIGNITLELKNWKRDGWKPPRYVN